MLQVEQAFITQGYGALTMRAIAKACDFSTRALYFYFSNKQETFRAVVRFRNELALTTGFEAGRKRREAGGDALDILSDIINIRYGDTRRMANASPHLIELNAQVFTFCTDILPVCIKAGALDVRVPARDLWISPHHAMFIDGVLIEARDLVNGISIVQAEQIEQVDYFHVELDTHDVIVAQGALSETFVDDDSRGMFHNVHEFDALYPDAARQPARYYAPRLEGGYEVEAVRRRIALRAGRAASDTIGKLRGCLDLVSAHCVAGWAQGEDHPEAPVCLDILAGGQLLGAVLANTYREDLAQAGLGSGCHSFIFELPAGLAAVHDAIEVRRSLDGAPLELAAVEKPRKLRQHG